MIVYLRGRDKKFHSVNLDILAIPIIIFIIVLALWVYQFVYTSIYNGVYYGAKKAILSGQPTYVTDNRRIAYTAMRKVLFADPEIFVLKGNSVYYHDDYEEGTKTYFLTYNSLLENYDEYLEQYNAKIQDIVDCMPQGLDLEGKYKFLHDYICANYYYDYSLYIGDAYEMLSEGKGVCAAYAQIYQSLCDCAHIQCHTIISENKNHAWNYVKIDKEWKHVDVTWDDDGGKDDISYKYFLIDDETLLKQDPERSDWYDCDINFSKIEKLRDNIYRYLLPLWIICLFVCLMPILRYKFFISKDNDEEQ